MSHSRRDDLRRHPGVAWTDNCIPDGLPHHRPVQIHALPGPQGHGPAVPPFLRRRVRCQECGTRQTLRWDDEVNETLAAARRCFTCAYWEALVQRDADGDPNVVRAKGRHFVIGESTGVGPQGFGGRRFVIEFFDGRVTETSNLWQQGAIPAHFTDRLPDNAGISTALPAVADRRPR